MPKLAKRKRDARGVLLKREFTPAQIRAICDAWEAGMPGIRMKREFGIGTTRIREIAYAAGCEPRGASWKPPPAFRVSPGRKPGLAPSGIKRGIPIKRALTLKDPDYTDPDAKRLMRRYCPVHRACIVDPKAPPDLWIVGRKRVSEREMRRMAAAG